MKRSIACRTLPFFLFGLLLGARPSSGQTEKPPDSPVFKNRPIVPDLPRIPQSDAVRQIWDTFMLERRANAGDLSAQNDLGVRYLLGKGIAADTAKAVHWIGRAAQGGHMLGQFNMALLYYHGTGVGWNPFNAFKLFRTVAGRGFVDAQYVLYQFFTENLVVARSIDSARAWLTKAAALGHAGAQEGLKNLAAWEKGAASADSVVPGAPDAIALSLIEDSLGAASPGQSMAGVLRATPAALRRTLGIDSLLATDATPDSLLVLDLDHAASAGNPEALLVLGRLHEKGIGFPRDSVAAAAYYLRASRLDAPRGEELLFSLVTSQAFVRSVKARALRGDRGAAFVWAELTLLGFGVPLGQQNAYLTPPQAVQMLSDGAKAGHMPSILALAACVYSGQGCVPDRARAFALWDEASAGGSTEAAVRASLVRLLDDASADSAGAIIALLQSAADQGSLPAEVGLGYCSERGIGGPMDPGAAARRYHAAAARGSRDAYRALRRLHDAIRPQESAFAIDE